ncbi:MAG: hypothetical protein ACREUW_09690 [Burkholderiales bacterium]
MKPVVLACVLALATGCSPADLPNPLAEIVEGVVIAHGRCKNHEDCRKREIVVQGRYYNVGLWGGGSGPSSGHAISVYGYGQDHPIRAELVNKLRAAQETRKLPCVELRLFTGPNPSQQGHGGTDMVCPRTQ